MPTRRRWGRNAGDRGKEVVTDDFKELAVNISIIPHISATNNMVLKLWCRLNRSHASFDIFCAAKRSEQW